MAPTTKSDCAPVVLLSRNEQRAATSARKAAESTRKGAETRTTTPSTPFCRGYCKRRRPFRSVSVACQPLSRPFSSGPLFRHMSTLFDALRRSIKDQRARGVPSLTDILWQIDINDLNDLCLAGAIIVVFYIFAPEGGLGAYF